MLRRRSARMVKNALLLVMLTSAAITATQAQGDDDLEALGRQFQQLGQQGKYADAAATAQRALALAERLNPGDQLTLAPCLDNLASADYAMGRTSEAEPLILRALAVREKALGPITSM
jgi:tetratricopeptide (TPR) repeat protein